MTLTSHCPCNKRISFNPHTHEGCDRSFTVAKVQNISVSIHTPTKGVTFVRREVSILTSCFNPHTHEGCDVCWQYRASPYYVSIHTPTKGVTRSSFLFHGRPGVSIHTPTKGVTSGDFYANGFTSVSIHTPTKGVTSGQHQQRYRHLVSIHTPTKGVTPCPLRLMIYNDCFNPHTHEGCDVVLQLFVLVVLVFQSTHPRRV